MKTRIYYLLIVFAGISVFTACKKMDSTYSQYVVPGGKPYPGQAKSAFLHPGKYRAKVEWLRGSDPKIVKSRIFWNNFADSIELNISADQTVISHTFENLEETFYTYTIRNYDAKGNASVPVEISGNVFGDRYQARILTRPVAAAYLTTTNALSITWNEADTLTGAYKTEVEYTSTSGTLKTVRFNAKEEVTEIADFRQGTSFRYRTMYLPDSLAIDTFYTGYLSHSEVLLNKADWKLIAFSDQYSSGNEAAKNMIDGTEYTRWHTNGSAYPHSITVDMGATRTITRFGLWRTFFDSPNGDDRAPTRVEFLISRDNVTWTSLGIFSNNNLVNGEQTFIMPANATGRYFKLVGLAGTNQYMVLGEVSAYIF